MIGYLTRVKLVAYGGLAGWFAGFLAGVPAEVLIGLRDTRGDPRFLAEIVMGLAVWAVWTMLLALGAWLIFAVPCVLVFPPALLVRFRTRVLLLTALLALVLAFTKLYPFRDHAASKLALSFVLYMPYGCFAVFFAVVTAWLYLRLAQE
jgi:hypothetical protein